MKSLKIIIFIVIAVLLIWGAMQYNKKSDEAVANQVAADQQRAQTEQQKIMDKLKIEDVRVGTGEEAKNGDVLTVNYIGTLDNGTKFDSSYDRNQTFDVTLGGGQVIQGWDLGLLGMKVGGKRNLTIPPELGYGDRGAGGIIPPNATLHFTVELVSLKHPNQ